MSKHVKHFDDLRFSVVAHVNQYYVEYTILEIYGWQDDEGDRLWCATDDHCCSYTDVMDQADKFAHGSVKWDGCSNWLFDAQERCMIHGCTRGDLTRLGEVLTRCWDWTAELCPNWSRQS